MSKHIKRPLAEAMEITTAFTARYLGSGPFEVAGSIRRQAKEIGDVDLVVSQTLDDLRSKFGPDVTIQRGGDDVLFLEFQGMVFNLYRAEPEYWGACLFYLTGPSNYQIAYRKRAKDRGLTLNQKGLFKGEERIAGKTESEVYEALGKEYKAPEIRGK